MNRRLGGAGIRRNLRSYHALGAAAAPYDPGDEADAVLDWYADEFVTEAGTGVSSWIDRIAGSDIIQGTDANRPTYESTGLNGKACVHFVRANSDWLSVATSEAFADESYSIIMLLDPKQVANVNAAIAQFNSRSVRLNMLSSGSAVSYTDGGAQYTIATGTTGAQVLRFKFDEATEVGTVYRNGSSIGTGTWTAATDHTTTADIFSMGASTVGTFFGDFAVRRWMRFTGIDDTRDARVEAWMLAEGGLA